eukprot:SAG11_NODE_20_length_25330_cov_18.348143_8_plen_187_part_00
MGVGARAQPVATAVTGTGLRGRCKVRHPKHDHATLRALTTSTCYHVAGLNPCLNQWWTTSTGGAAIGSGAGGSGRVLLEQDSDHVYDYGFAVTENDLRSINGAAAFTAPSFAAHQRLRGDKRDQDALKIALEESALEFVKEECSTTTANAQKLLRQEKGDAQAAVRRWRAHVASMGAIGAHKKRRC